MADAPVQTDIAKLNKQDNIAERQPPQIGGAIRKFEFAPVERGRALRRFFLLAHGAARRSQTKRKGSVAAADNRKRTAFRLDP